MIRLLLLAAFLSLAVSLHADPAPLSSTNLPPGASPTLAPDTPPPSSNPPVPDYQGPNAAAPLDGMGGVPGMPNAKHGPIPAPAWKLVDSDGKSHELSDYHGKVVLLDFFATWCPPCQQEMPNFVALQRKYGATGLAIIGVSLDAEGPAAVKPFIQNYGINFPIVFGAAPVTAAYGGIEAIPTAFLIDRDGNMVAKEGGYTDRAQFESQIVALLMQKAKKK
jgi:peroxiredoxin